MEKLNEEIQKRPIRQSSKELTFPAPISADKKKKNSSASIDESTKRTLLRKNNIAGNRESDDMCRVNSLFSLEEGNIGFSSMNQVELTKLHL